MKTTSFAALLAIGTGSFLVACTAAPAAEADAADTDEALVVGAAPQPLPAPIPNGPQCSSVSIAQCFGSTLGGPCGPIGGGGVCASFQSRRSG